ncbi:Putative TEA/ATTS domain-containing protein [Septoria linicola]|uniref:TEA/ATTS domain-containing protein n=1 Tax=Septoria linicola TaxID=215465 RepID=A0A9Q9ARH9_9PEZI|nr:putative TEA/ATTS domain-containing protein [Septoria linicola]USW53244.1 Putative TEA/ATTS domain-containing protein [Septoria linicola]
MTLLQPTPIVPSNAPPRSDDVSGRSSRVLQEHSGNRQQDYYGTSLEQKYPSSYLSENSYPAYHVPRPAFISNQTLRQHNHLRQHPHSRLHHGHRDPQQLRKEARYLFHRFRSSDGYMKYRNRQQKDDKNAEQKWPDRLEYTFFEALVNWPPMGRRKLPHKDKQRGRNELIADYIEEKTGESRTRKQVSSHIQVLKPFVESDPHIMRYLSKDDLSGPGHTQRYFTQGHGYYAVGGRRASQYPAHAPAYTTKEAMPSDHETNLYHTVSSVKKHLSVFQLTSFEMFVQCRDLSSEENPLHMYTRNIKNPLLSELRPTWDEFNADFPLLAAMHAARPIDCNVLFADVSIAFSDRSWKDKTGIELGISLTCSSKYLPQDAQVFCCNRFYRNGELVKGHGGTDHVPLDVVSADRTSLDTQLKFGSTFWARTLAYLATKLKATEAQIAEGHDPLADVNQYLSDTTACQEIVIKMPDNTAERLLIIYWKFCRSTAEPNKYGKREGVAYWRPIKLPSPAPVEASRSPYKANACAEPKSGRVDSVFDYNPQAYGGDAYTTTQPAALQSPFEYDNSSGPESTLNSATWATSASYDMPDGSMTGPQSAIDIFSPSADNSFDFSGGNINISYDNMDLSTFDAAAFDFSTSADFVTDPTLEQYASQSFTQQDFDTQWYDNFGGETHQQTQAPLAPMTAGSASEEISHDGGEQQHHYDFGIPAVTCDTTNSQLAEAIPAYDDYTSAAYNHDQQYGQDYGLSPHEAQAYGGAGQEVVVKVESDAPAYIASEVPLERAGSQGYDEQEQRYHTQ